MTRSLVACTIAGSLAACLELSAAARATGIVAAVRDRDGAAVAALLRSGADVGERQPDGTTALHWAAHWDDARLAGLLVGAGAAVDAANDYGVTPLSLACANGNAAVVGVLVASGADVNRPVSTTGETPLMLAARSGSLDTVNRVIERGAAVNAAEPTEQQTALMWAVAERHPDVVRTLLAHGADVRARSKSGFTPLLFAAREGDLDTARMLVAAGADVNEADRTGASALLVATVRGQTAVAQDLLERGADPNSDGAGYTALHWAAGSWDSLMPGVFGRNAALVKALVAHGAAPNARAKKSPPRFGRSLFQKRLEGATPFFVAALAGHVEAMRLLVAHGADPRLATNDNFTPLMAAAGLGRVVGENLVSEADGFEATKLALELGNDVNAVDGGGETALHGAAYVGADRVAALLADHGAQLSVKNRKGQTPLAIALGEYKSGVVVIVHQSTADLLRARGATR